MIDVNPKEEGSVCGSPEVRALFPITQGKIYFNHAAVSPPPITTIRAIEAQLKDVHENGSLNFTAGWR
jgi:hypothetical protein